MQFDFCFVHSAEDPAIKATVLTGYHQRSGLTMAIVLPEGKRAASYPIEAVVAFVQECRVPAAQLVLQHDSESSVKAILDAASKRVGCSVREAKDSPSNGGVENAHKRIQGMARTFKLEVEAATQVKLSVTHPMFSWIIRHSAWVLNRFQKRTSNGLTPLESLTNQTYKSTLGKLGEKILGKVDPEEIGKADARWVEGVFLGRSADNDSVLVGTSEGVLECRSVRAIGEESVYSADLINRFVGTPWDAKGRLGCPNGTGVPPAGGSRIFARGWKFPRTPGCTGCHSKGKHSSECRKRRVRWMQDQEEKEAARGEGSNPRSD